MPAGIQVFGSHGVRQIDSDYRNLLFKTKVTVNHATRDGVIQNPVGASEGFSWNYKSLSFSGVVSPVVAVTLAGGSGRVWFGGTSIESGLYRVRLFYTAVTGTFTYYLFDAAPPSPASSYLFEVYRSDGTLAFSPDSKFMRVVSTSDPVAVPAGRTYAVAQGRGGYDSMWIDALDPFDPSQDVYTYEGPAWYGGGGGSSIGKETRVLNAHYYMPTNVNGWMVTGAKPHLILDVTGL